MLARAKLGCGASLGAHRETQGEYKRRRANCREHLAPRIVVTERLERVSLRRTLIGAGCLREIAQTPEAARLRGLELYDNDVTNAGLADLAASPYLPNLTDLGLGATRITTVGVRALAESPLLPRLRRLVLRGNSVYLLGSVSEALAASDHRLTELDLAFTAVTELSGV